MEDEEGKEDKRTGDCDVEAAVSLSTSLSGVNVSVSAFSVKAQQDIAG